MKRNTRAELKAAAEVVVERSEGRCEAILSRARGCNGWGAELHHVIPRARTGGRVDNRPENLLHVSAACHAWIHANPERATELGYLRSAPPVDPMELER